MTLILSGTDGLSDIDGSAATPAIRGTDANTGIFFPAADTIAFSEGGVEAMRIDSSGNLLVGGTSTSALDGTFGIVVGGSSKSSGAVAYECSNSQFITYTDTTQALIFYDSRQNAERARIDSSGNLLVGTTSGISVAGVGGTNSFSTPTANKWAMSVQHTNASTPWGIAINYSAAVVNNTSQAFIYCYDNTPRFYVASNGGVYNYSANNSNLSDRREKTNFALAKPYLDVICAIPVQTFNYIDQNMEEDGGLTLGVVAQDVQAVAPELVMESNWAKEGDEPKMRLSIYQTDLQYALMKCIQEQQALITQLQADVAALKASA